MRIKSEPERSYKAVYTQRQFIWGSNRGRCQNDTG